ncbi:hypothetical protein GGI07_005182 [Coemansia sp. Benny D115]|nr:hypothetical protein GGI07_005182 [Coemansia sp. Benny D115]
MADIERQILQQIEDGLGDEDKSERDRARENGDVPEDENPSDSDGHVVNTAPPHDGPQTGVKGVLADYHHSRLLQRQQQLDQAAADKKAYEEAAQKSIKDKSDRTFWTKEESQDSGDSSDLDDLLLDDQDDETIFAEYRNKRMTEMNQVAERIGLGTLKDVTPDEYVDIVDKQDDTGIHVLVLLVDSGDVSRRIGQCIGQLAAEFRQTVFLRVAAEECGFEDASVVPIVLVYRNGELKHNLVRVTDRIGKGSSFELRDVKSLLEEILYK